jgi:hypothetical protein
VKFAERFRCFHGFGADIRTKRGDDSQKKALTYLKVKDFAKRFKEINGTINCTEF